MSPEFKIKKTILLSADVLTDPTALTTDEEVKAAWSAARDNPEFEDNIIDRKEDFRSGQYKTEIEPDYSRHYESRSVASQMFDGSWVGWTYWYGGGKHGEPSAIDWMPDAYNVDFKEETVVVKKFFKL